MKRRGQDDRLNDVTATECDACGFEGYTGKGGGTIHSYYRGPESGARKIELCETCTGQFSEASDGKIAFDSDVLTESEWEQVNLYKNRERLDREDETLANDLCGAFCDVLNEWLTPAEKAEVLRLNNTEHNLSICHTHDFCDANQAMLDAWELVFGKDEAPSVITAGTTDDQKEFDNSIWNAAWSKARAMQFGFLAGKK